MRHVGLDLPGFRHQALFYADEDELLAGTLPAVRDALAREAGVLIALPERSSNVLREALGPEADATTFANMEELGRNPGRIIAAWRTFVRRCADRERPPLGIGEPAWPGRSEAELAECGRHETLLNLAFSPGPEWRLLCPYDAANLEPAVLDRARRNHPHVTEGGTDGHSHAYAREIPGDEPLPPPAAKPAEMPFTFDDLPTVREVLARRAGGAGMRGRRLGDLVLAIDELATNTLRYAGGEGVLRIWIEDGELLCEISDGGHIADPLAGRELPPPSQIGGRGLWLVNQLCDLVQLRSAPGSSVVRVHMRLDG